MGTIPVPHTWTAGDDATSSALQTLTDTCLFLLGSATSGGSKKALARLRQTVAQTIPTGVWTAVTFDVEDDDYDNGHSTSSNTDQYVAGETAKHIVAGGCGFAGNVTGRRGVRYTVGGTAVNGSEAYIPASAAATGVCVAGRCMIIPLNAGDILRLETFQETGGNLATLATAQQQATLHAAFFSN
jgi:hypothetical protein